MMKRYLLIPFAVLLGSTGFLVRPSATLLAFNGGAPSAREHGQDRDDEDRDRRRDERREHRRFEDHDRREARDWYEHHREYRDRDRYAPEYESRFRAGYVLDPDLRRDFRPVPDDLLVRLAPPPRHCRYVMVGGHICLIDRDYRVVDVIHLEFNM